MYSIDFDRSEGIIRAVCRGVWEGDEAERYSADMQRWIDRARTEVGVVRLLLDLREYQVQSAETVAAWRQSGLAVLQSDQDRIALFMDAGLARMQVRRIVSSDQTRVFPNEAEARAWLAETSFEEGARRAAG